MASSSKTTLWGKPTLFVHVTLSPALMVTVEGSKTRAPPSAPSFTLAALAERASPREAMPTPAALANLHRTASASEKLCDRKYEWPFQKVCAIFQCSILSPNLLNSSEAGVQEESHLRSCSWTSQPSRTSALPACNLLIWSGPMLHLADTFLFLHLAKHTKASWRGKSTGHKISTIAKAGSKATAEPRPQL